MLKDLCFMFVHSDTLTKPSGLLLSNLIIMKPSRIRFFRAHDRHIALSL